MQLKQLLSLNRQEERTHRKKEKNLEKTIRIPSIIIEGYWNSVNRAMTVDKIKYVKNRHTRKRRLQEQAAKNKLYDF